MVKLTLGKPGPQPADPTLRNVFVRPVQLKVGPHLSFVWRHATRDITKNYPAEEAVAVVDSLLGSALLDAHLFTPVQTVQYESTPAGTAHIRLKTAATAPAIPSDRHDRDKHRVISTTAPWLHALGVTNEAGRPREGMAPKLRQIEKFAELLTHLLAESGLGPPETDVPAAPIEVVDMGCGKGYLTFAVAALLGTRARVHGIEARPELVALDREVARLAGFSHLTFIQGEIASAALPESSERIDVLLALHACDTATDDALARGIRAGARLLVVSPCCQKELRPQITPPAVLAPVLHHGILLERQAEFVTDALRALLLEVAGYRTKVLEFVSTEHTARNIMIAAVRDAHRHDPSRTARVRALAEFYGIRHHRLADHLGLSLVA